MVAQESRAHWMERHRAELRVLDENGFSRRSVRFRVCDRPGAWKYDTGTGDCLCINTKLRAGALLAVFLIR
jgi:hypothetical protein